jgi:hypothetical protein
MALPELPGDPALRLAALTALGLAAVTLLVMLHVLAISAWATHERRRREAFNRAWRPRLALAAIDEADFGASAPLRGRRRLWWLMLWNRVQRQLRGEATARLNRVLRRMGLDAHARRMLHRPGVRRRLVALETMRHVGDRSCWSDVEPLLQAGNPFVSLAAAEALVAMDAGEAMRRILPLALRRVDWGRQRVVALCRQAGPAAVTPPLLELLELASPAGVSRLVPLLSTADPARIAPWARTCALEDPDPRDRLAAFQALDELRDPRDRELFIRGFGDPDPGVRLAAVTALSRQARAEDVDVLVPLLSDRSWWVRRRAADTLAVLPRVSEAQLQALLPAIEDRYGREALSRALAERHSREDDR